MTRPRVLGTCYVCGRTCFGYRAVRVPTMTPEKGKVVVRDALGVRHGKCTQVRTATGIAPSDA